MVSRCTSGTTKEGCCHVHDDSAHLVLLGPVLLLPMAGHQLASPGYHGQDDQDDQDDEHDENDDCD